MSFGGFSRIPRVVRDERNKKRRDAYAKKQVSRSEETTDKLFLFIDKARISKHNKLVATELVKGLREKNCPEETVEQSVVVYLRVAKLKLKK